MYVLRSEKTGRLYKGMTRNLPGRLKAHNLGKTRSTKGGRPWKLIYFEEYATLQEALAREKYLKTAAGRRCLKKILAVRGSPPD